ncbi:MAG: hypothetical protein KBD29_03580 [Candidatus Magasanikbacteria bacterium]|nr:hypothetical protein [Candidatus Magasanikbacteria bacterium]
MKKDRHMKPLAQTEGIPTVKVILHMLPNKEKYSDETIMKKYEYLRKLNYGAEAMDTLHEAFRMHRPHLLQHIG